MSITASVVGKYYSAFADVAPSTVFVEATDLRFSATDYVGTLLRTTSVLRITRPIVDGQGFEYCSPEARCRFTLDMPTAGTIEVNCRYTGTVTRTDTFNPDAVVLVDGVEYHRYTQTKALPATPHPAANVSAVIVLAPGSHTVEIIYPYCAAFDFQSIRHPVNATLRSAAPRPSKSLVAFGDSRIQGFSSTDATKSLVYLLSGLLGVQVKNLGYGGRQLIPGDGTVAGAAGADAGLVMVDFNNFYPNGQSTATFQTNAQSLISNFRAASTAAGKPHAPLYWLTSIDAPSAYGGGTYASNSPTLEAFRVAERAAVAASGDPYCFILEGLGAGMPTGAGSFPDGIHANDAAQATIAAIIAPQMLF